MRRSILLAMSLVSAAALVVAQGEKLDFATLGSIRDEGLNRSQVMDHVSWLSDVYGPRLTGSPGIVLPPLWILGLPPGEEDTGGRKNVALERAS